MFVNTSSQLALSTIVAGTSAVGTAPTENPVSVSGVDGSGLKRSLLTDSIGRVNTVVPDCAEVSGSASSADVLFTVDMLNYASVTVNLTSAGSGCTIAWETSSDGLTNWVGVSGAVITPSQSSVGLSPSISAINAVAIPKRLRYFRARVSIYGSGTVSVIGNLSSTPLITSVVSMCVGPASEGANVSGVPLTISVEARTSRKTAVGNGQVVRPIATQDGRMIMRPHSIPENEWKYAAASGGSLNNSTTSATIAGAGGAGLSIYLTSMQIFSEALTNATEVVIRDGASGTVLWRHKISSSGMGLNNVTFADPIKGTANTLMEVATLTAVGAGSIYVNAQGYYAP